MPAVNARAASARSHRHPCVTTWVDGQSGRTLSGEDRCVHSLPPICGGSAKIPLRDFYAISAKIPTGLGCDGLFYGGPLALITWQWAASGGHPLAYPKVPPLAHKLKDLLPPELCNSIRRKRSVSGCRL